MASAKQFRGNKCAPNKTVAATIKSGAKCKILEQEEKVASVSGEPCIGIKVKEFNGFIRVNPTNLDALAAAFGDETENWVGKTIQFAWADTIVQGQVQKVLTLKPC